MTENWSTELRYSTYRCNYIIVIHIIPKHGRLIAKRTHLGRLVSNARTRAQNHSSCMAMEVDSLKEKSGALHGQ